MAKDKKVNFDALRTQLIESGEWPRVYFFKFIIPADNKKLALVEALFGVEANVTIKQSSKGNYSSISAKELPPKRARISSSVTSSPENRPTCI